MGFSGGSEIFDTIAHVILGVGLHNPSMFTEDQVIQLAQLTHTQKVALLKVVIEALEQADWDDCLDHNYRSNPLVLKAVRELHPDWTINKRGYVE